MLCLHPGAITAWQATRLPFLTGSWSSTSEPESTLGKSNEPLKRFKQFVSRLSRNYTNLINKVISFSQWSRWKGECLFSLKADATPRFGTVRGAEGSPSAAGQMKVKPVPHSAFRNRRTEIYGCSNEIWAPSNRLSSKTEQRKQIVFLQHTKFIKH